MFHLRLPDIPVVGKDLVGWVNANLVNPMMNAWSVKLSFEFESKQFSQHDHIFIIMSYAPITVINYAAAVLIDSQHISPFDFVPRRSARIE